MNWKHKYSDSYAVSDTRPTPEWDEYAGEIPVPVPVEVTPRQARRALLAAGLLDDVEAALDAISDPQVKAIAKIEWATAQQVRRDWPLLLQVAGQMGLTDEQLDALFVAASAI